MTSSNQSEPALRSIQLPSSGPSISVDIFAGRPVYVLGRNGTGKSALMHTINAQTSGQSIYLPGSRSLHFDNEGLSLTAASRKHLTTNLIGNDRNVDTRWKPLMGTSRNEKAIFDLQNSEIQYGADAVRQIKEEGATSTAILRLLSSTSPFERLNSLLEQANLPIRIQFTDGEAKAEQEGNIYSYAKTSDGERAALLFASEVLTAKPQSIFVVDEPELHLHPSIVIPLLQSLIRERPDCGFVISTHELGLPAATKDASIVFVRKCIWQNQEARTWDLDLLPDTNVIPEDLKLDVLGSRRKILFIEGTSTSLDAPLYSLLFPEVSLAAKEGCKEVVRAVKGLRAVTELHHVLAFGLIDNDGMSAAQIAEHEAQHIYPLSCFAVESLYYDVEVQKALAAKQAKALRTQETLVLDRAKIAALKALGITTATENLAAKVAERHIRDAILSQLPQKDDLIAGGSNNVNITIQSTYASELGKIKSYLQANDLQAIIEKYPVRESGALVAIANGLRFIDRGDYEKAALTVIGESAPLRLHLKAKLLKLGTALSI